MQAAVQAEHHNAVAAEFDRIHSVERAKQVGSLDEIVAAEMTTAAPITEELKQRARSALQRVTGAKVRLTCNVEPDLIGGAVIRAGDLVIDGSLRGRLERLASVVKH